MRGLRTSTPRRRARRAGALLFLLSLAVFAPSSATAGAWPNLLDNNTSGNFGPALQAVAQLVAPLVCQLPVCKVQAGGRVVANPKIVDLYWDDNWDAHNPKSPTRAEINASVQLVAASEYLDDANQYGVHRGNFLGAHASSTLCQTMRPTAPNGSPASHTNPGSMGIVPLLAWVTCEVNGSVATGVPTPDNNTIYTVFLPEGVKTTGQPGATCGLGNHAFHMTAAAILPNQDADFALGVLFKLVAFPVIVMPAECALGTTHSETMDEYTKLFSHELVEAARDPVAPTGWIDNRWAPDIGAWTSKGEPGDICEGRTAAYANVVTNPAGLPDGINISPGRLRSNGALVGRYWSNKDKQCVPIALAPYSTTPTPTRLTPTTKPKQTTATPTPTSATKTTTSRTHPTTTVTRPTTALPAGSGSALAGAWSHLGDAGRAGTASLNGAVYALNADAPGLLYAGGSFTSAGGNSKAAHLASWNGSKWAAVGSPALNGDVHAIAYHAGKVYVGGVFKNAGGDPNLDFLAEWDGSKWGAVCNTPGPAVTANVNALQIIGSTLYIGGSFANGAGIDSADFLLACDLRTGVASSTVAKDGDFAGAVYALAADSQGTLYAGGGFSNVAGIPAADNIAAYSGGAWHALGSGASPGGGPIDDFVRSLAAHGTDLYVGTDAKNVGGIAQADHVAKWNGSAWSALGSSGSGNEGWFPASSFIYALTSSGPRVFAAGSFQNANGDPHADQIAYFDGTTWHALGSNGANGPWIGYGLALALFKSKLYAGGSFTSAGSDPLAHGIASSTL